MKRIKKIPLRIFPFFVAPLLLFACDGITEIVTYSVRIPAEWEPHEATWMQWPLHHEHWSRECFAEIIDALQEYETVNILVTSDTEETAAREYLTDRGIPLTNINWYIADYNWSWMRDNGPVYAVDNDGLFLQNWGFDGWGVEENYEGDDDVPLFVAETLDMRCEDYSFINERGTLEFNGKDTLITSWPCLSDRNPGVTREEMESMFIRTFGVTRVVWLLSYSEDDITKGHADGFARFIDEDTVVVPRFVDQSDPEALIYEEAASIVEDAGFEVLRLDIPGYIDYLGVPMYANYVNWLVANGVVVVPGFDVPEWDNAAKTAIEGFFPGRDVYVVDTRELWYNGGAVHCVTNDQPAL